MLTRIHRPLIVASLLTALVLFVGATAHADSVTFTGGYSGNPVLTINDPALGTVTGYIDPYTGNIGTQSVLLWCVDPNHDAPPVGTTYTANITAAGNLTGMSNTSQVINNGLTPNGANTLYGELAALILKMENPGNKTLADQEIQGAIWQLAAGVANLSFPNPPAVPTGTFQGAVTGLEIWAANNALTSGFEVVTDANEKSDLLNGTSAYQEYIVMTPEPSTLLLMGLGLISLFWFSRRKAISAGLAS